MSNVQTESYDPNLNYQYFAGEEGGSDTQRKLAAIQLPDLREKRFLDLGCNAGFFCGHALSQGAARVVGVDNSPKVIAVARSRHPGVEFFDTGWDKFPGGEFDTVICLSAIHYARNAIRLLENIWTHLSEGGLLILEGGLVGEDVLAVTDLPVVCWREVGDKARHLSARFLQRHAMDGFEWRVLGPSVSQGGDPISRFVIHARKRSGERAQRRAPGFTLCASEYARALALSASTIQPSHASFDYVRRLGEAIESNPEDAAAIISGLLAEDAALGAFADDVAFAIAGYSNELRLVPSLGDELTQRLAAALRERGVSIQSMMTAEAAEPQQEDPENSGTVMGRMEAGVEFIADEEGYPFESVLNYCALSGARVAAFCGAGMVQRLLAAGVVECNVTSGFAAAAEKDERIVEHETLPWQVNVTGLKYVFFDASAYNSFDYVDDAARLAAALPRLLAGDGHAYVVLRTGLVQSDWDVYNSVLITPIGRLPSSEYLFNGLLRQFAVRPLLRITEPEEKPYCSTRIFRLAPRRPSLLLVTTASHGGKTTLSRSLRRSPGAFHVSNDYIFYELFRLRGAEALPGCSSRLLQAVSGGTAEHVGRFFRALESDEDLFLDYLALLRSLIPEHELDVSLDLDLRTDERLEQAKAYFREAGFSVWAVSR